jgi:hypothetical protein
MRFLRQLGAGLLLVIIDRFWHLAELDVEVEAEGVGAFFLACLYIYWLDRRQVHRRQVLIHEFLGEAAAHLVNSHQVRARLVLLHHLKALLLCGYLGVVLQDALAFVRSLVVLASEALAVVQVARDAGLEALAVLLETLALLAVAALGVSLLSALAVHICCVQAILFPLN